MEKNKIPAEEALQSLMEGNKRFMANDLLHPHSDQAHRLLLTQGQAPHTVVLTCADSRLIPDLIFDQGFGDLFVIRVAGNVAKDKVLGSIEYAIEHLGSQLVMVLGHEKCGAVTAALEPVSLEGHIGSIIEEIQPAVFLARHQKGDLLENSIKNNAMLTKERIHDSLPIINRAVREKGVKVVSAYYMLGSGEVQIIE